MTAMSKPAPAKKPQISQFRRILWHVNRTDLGWITKAVMSSLDSERASRRALLATLPTDPRWSQASEQLDEQGYADVTNLVSRQLAEAVAAVSDDKAARAEELVAKQKLGHKGFWVSLLDEDLVGGAFPVEHAFVRYAMQPAILRIIGDFMGDLPRLSDVLLTLSRPSEDQPLSFSQLWHLDHDDKRVCKLFIYLTDVDSRDDGPFTFIPAPASRPFRNSLKSHLSDDQVFKKTGADAVKEMIAPRLSSFLVNTARCLHMGSRIKSGHRRLLYTATYIQPPRIYPEPPPRFRSGKPLDELSRAVLNI